MHWSGECKALDFSRRLHWKCDLGVLLACRGQEGHDIATRRPRGRARLRHQSLRDGEVIENRKRCLQGAFRKGANRKSMCFVLFCFSTMQITFIWLC